MQALFENSIVNHDGPVETSTVSPNVKVVGLYFSAHWCPPCRGFTPKLADWYKTQKEGEDKDAFDIVFVSCDRDEAAFKDYYKDMPWLALDFKASDIKEKLSKLCAVSGIPKLAFVDVTKPDKPMGVEGRGHVAANSPISEILAML